MKKSDLESMLKGDTELNQQIQIIKSAIAEDLKSISKGKVDNLKILNLDDYLYKRVTDLLKQVIKKEKPETADDLDIPVKPLKMQDIVLKGK